jgi:hypothetical protein
VAPDGTLLDTIRVHWHGLPAGQATLRARREPEAQDAGPAPSMEALVPG